MDGLVWSYDQDDYPGILAYHSFYLVENGQTIVVVDKRFTAGRLPFQACQNPRPMLAIGYWNPRFFPQIAKLP